MTLLASLDATTPSAEDTVFEDEQFYLMHDLLDTLTEREAGIVSMRLYLVEDDGSGCWGYDRRRRGRALPRPTASALTVPRRSSTRQWTGCVLPSPSRSTTRH